VPSYDLLLHHNLLKKSEVTEERESITHERQRRSVSEQKFAHENYSNVNRFVLCEMDEDQLKQNITSDTKSK
jgi:hypothetical protein